MTDLERAAQQEPVALKKGECWPEDVMQMWDYYRKEIANGNTGSEPRDWFESLAEMRLVDTRPQARDALSDEQKKEMFINRWGEDSWRVVGAFYKTGIEDAEAAHGIK